MTRGAGCTTFSASQGDLAGQLTVPAGMLSRSPAKPGRPVVPAEDMPAPMASRTTRRGAALRPAGCPPARAGGSAAGRLAAGRICGLMLSSLHGSDARKSANPSGTRLPATLTRFPPSGNTGGKIAEVVSSCHHCRNGRRIGR